MADDYGMRDLMRTFGEPVEINRDGKTHVIEGNPGKEYVMFYPDSDVQYGDIITGTISKRVFHVIGVKPTVVDRRIINVRALVETDHARRMRLESEQRQQLNRPIFDQRGQQVTYQYNAAGDINIGAAQNRAELVTELRKLKGEVEQATAQGALASDVGSDASDQLDKAAQQAERPTPNKNVLVGYLTTAQELVKEAAAAAGLVGGLAQAIEKARALF